MTDLADIDAWLARGGAIGLAQLASDAGYRELEAAGTGHDLAETTVNQDKVDLVNVMNSLGLTGTDDLDRLIALPWVPAFIEEYGTSYTRVWGRPPQQYPIDIVAVVVLVAMQGTTRDMRAGRLAMHVYEILTAVIASGRYA